MVSSPIFDPNKFVHGINTKDWKELINHRDKPLVNKSISGLYPPGSTIKGLVAISALENDVVNTKMVRRCTGSIDFYGEKFHCWKKKGHGVVDMRKAIKESCDVYFYEVARRLGIDRLSETARAFGFGKSMMGWAGPMAAIGMGTEMFGQGEANRMRKLQQQQWLDEEEDRRIARLNKYAGYDVTDPKNFLTPQWLKEFEEMKRQAASSKRQASSRKRVKQQAPSVKLQADIKNPG